MYKAIEFSVKHPVSALMYFSLVIILGAVGIFCVNKSLLPQTKDRSLLVSAAYEGVRANEIKKLVALPLEESLASLKDVKNCESVSRDGICVIKIELKWAADADAALLETNAILDSAMEALPDDCSRPQAKKISVSAGQARICVVPKTKDLCAATDFAKNELKTKLLSLKECSQAEVFGVQKRELKAIVDSQKAAFYGLSLDDVTRALNLSNYDYPAGTIQDGRDDILLKTEGTFKNFGEILDTALKAKQGQLRLKDIARLEKSVAKSGAFNFCDGEPCVELLAYCKKNQNPLAFSKKVKALCAELSERDKDFNVFVADDSSLEIVTALQNLLAAALVGVAAAFALTMLFFRSAKIALLIASAIPLCALFCVFVLLCLGKSVNIISLAGITLCLGMTIDNGIVAMESVLEGADKKNFHAALCASIKKIALANSASTITTIIVFVPVFFIGGIYGELFCDLGVAAIAGMAFSLAFSFMALPAVCSLFFKKEILTAKPADLSALEARYKKILAKTNRVKRLCPALMVSAALLSIAALVGIKKEFQPKGRQSSFSAAVDFEPGTSLERLAREARTISRRMADTKGVRLVLAQAGLDKDKPVLLADPQRQMERLCFFVKCSDVKKTKAVCAEFFKSRGLSFRFEEPLDLLSERLGVQRQSVFLGDDQDALFEECQEFFGENFFPKQKKIQRLFKADKGRMEILEVTPLALASALKASFDGTEAFPFYENGNEIPFRVQHEENEFASNKNLASLKIPSPKGMASLSSLGSWQEEKSECVFYRINGKDAKIILGDAKKPLPKSERRRIISLRNKNMEELFKSGAVLLAVVLILLYCVLGAQTESFTTPLIYLTAVPPAFLGAALFLALFGSSLNINSIMAFVALFGTSVNNSIILCEGGTKKFSSVLATTGTSVASLLPFAIDPFGLNPQSSLALAMAGGLLFSAAACLVLTPNILALREAKK